MIRPGTTLLILVRKLAQKLSDVIFVDHILKLAAALTTVADHQKPQSFSCLHRKIIFLFPEKRECKYHFLGILKIPGINCYLHT
jgi:hypothetical protein